MTVAYKRTYVLAAGTKSTNHTGMDKSIYALFVCMSLLTNLCYRLHSYVVKIPQISFFEGGGCLTSYFKIFCSNDGGQCIMSEGNRV